MSYAATDPALLQLFKILRDRGSISDQEYELLMSLANSPDANKGSVQPPAPSLPSIADLQPSKAGETNSPAKPGTPDVAQGPGAGTTNLPPIAVVKPAVPPTATPVKEEKKWYQKFDVGGYTQIRTTALLDPEADLLNVPNDPSVSPSQLFMIRRGRFKMSGDINEHVSMYAQVDVSAYVSSGSSSQFSVQLRDLYTDIFPVDSHDYRFRIGQTKVPYGWVNMQSSQNRSPMERPDPINSAAEGERDLGAFFMYAPEEVRHRLKELVQLGLKGSGDYGMVDFGAYNGQGINRPDLNGTPYWLARGTYPFKFDNGQFFEVGLQGYLGKFVPTVQQVTYNGKPVTPTFNSEGVTDRRVALSAVWYPQPFGVQTEWNVGQSPQLSGNYSNIGVDSLWGGYVEVTYQINTGHGKLFPYSRWQIYEGARKFAANAPYETVNELDFGFEYSPWKALELSVQYTHTFERSNTTFAPYPVVEGANRIEFQVQFNY